MAIATVTNEMIALAAQAADAKGATALVGLEVAERFPFADAFLIISGEVERNVQAISDNIEDELNLAGFKTLRREGKAEGRWILLDFGELIVHVFHEEEREYYEIERLWRDCPSIDVTRHIAGLQEGAQVR